jgi:hypothetical protein
MPKSVVVLAWLDQRDAAKIPSKRADAIGTWLDETGARNIRAWQCLHIFLHS